MPHCIAEHSTDIHGPTLLPVIFLGVFESGLFATDGNDIKVRTLTYDHCTTGNRTASFIHVTLKILSGRTAAQKTDLSHRVTAKIMALGLHDVSVTVEVIDIDRASYSKVHTT